MAPADFSIERSLDALYRAEGGRLHAAPLRRVRDMDLVEEAVHDALVAALVEWRTSGAPNDPVASLARVAHNKAIDRSGGASGATASCARSPRRLRARRRRCQVRTTTKTLLDEDDRLRLVFLCCHPALPLEVAPSPVVELNRAAALAMAEGPALGLALLDDLRRRGELDGYHLFHCARADLLRRLGRAGEARVAYERASRPDRLGPGAALPGAAPSRKFRLNGDLPPRRACVMVIIVHARFGSRPVRRFPQFWKPSSLQTRHVEAAGAFGSPRPLLEATGEPTSERGFRRTIGSTTGARTETGT